MDMNLFRRRSRQWAAAFFILSAILMALHSCGGSSSKIEDFDREVYKPRFASSFRILGSDSGESLIVETKTPWQGAGEGDVRRLFISRNGEQAPEGFDGPVLRDSAMNIIAMSSTHVAMLEAVGKTPRVKGVSGIDYISNPYIRRNRDRIADVGYDSQIDYEKVLALKPDLVLLYGVTGSSPMEAKLRELGIPYIYIGEYLEENPLGKAEWMVVMAELTGNRSDGERAFAGIPKRYEALRKKVAESGEPAPKVMINTPYADSWVLASRGSYVATLIKDAGGDYMYRGTGTKSEPIDMELAYSMVSEADKWINLGQITSRDGLKKALPKFADTKPVVTGEVYNTVGKVLPNGANDYWETGVVQPDVVLRDLVRILHPSLLSDSLVYYRRL